MTHQLDYVNFHCVNSVRTASIVSIGFLRKQAKVWPMFARQFDAQRCAQRRKMKFGYKFSSLLGTVYKSGNILFTPDGTSLLSPAGNKINVYNLANHTSATLPIEAKSDITAMAMSPDSSILIVSDAMGRSVIVNFLRYCILGRMSFRGKPKVIKFSPDGKYPLITSSLRKTIGPLIIPRYFLVAVDNTVRVYTCPKRYKDFSLFRIEQSWKHHHSTVVSADWAPDSLTVVSAAKDGMITINILKQKILHKVFSAKGGRGVYFDSTGKVVYAISKYRIYVIEFVDNKWETMNAKEIPIQGAVVQTTALSKKNNLLMVGYTNGVFNLYDMPTCTNLHSVTISQQKIRSIDVNLYGEWIAFACPSIGQLIVWEWQSERYVLKQQGHVYSPNTVCYSPDGQLVVSGADDNKVKVWNTTTGFCFVTFTDHTAPITQVLFSPKLGSHVVFSSSRDGTVRAFDLLRYRNFRTFAAAVPYQYSCLAVDPSGEIVCAGCEDSFEIVLWSVQTGKVLDILSGHTGPVSCLAFNPTSQALASVSWDKYLILWNVFEGKPSREPLYCESDLLAVAYLNSPSEVCVSGLNGQLTFWDTKEGVISSMIDAKNDLDIGFISTDTRRTSTTPTGKHFTCITYVPDGSCLLAGGDSRFICMYELRQKLLIRKFQTTTNLSLEGVSDQYPFWKQTEFGSLDEIEADYGSDEEEDKSLRVDHSMPGAIRGDLSDRNIKQIARTRSISCSPTGRAWAAASTEGVLIYSIDHMLLFDPLDLDTECNPETIMKALDDKEYLKSVVMSFRLNEKEIIKKVLEGIPPQEIQFVAYNFPLVYIQRLLEFLGVNMEWTRHVELHQLWISHVLTGHGQYIKENSTALSAPLRSILKSTIKWQKDLAKLSDDNLYTLDYFSGCPSSVLPPDTRILKEEADRSEEEKEIQEVKVKMAKVELKNEEEPPQIKMEEDSEEESEGSEEGSEDSEESGESEEEEIEETKKQPKNDTKLKKNNRVSWSNVDIAIPAWGDGDDGKSDSSSDED